MKHLASINVLFKVGSCGVPEEYRAELSYELLQTNIKRIKVLSVILVVISCILLYIDIDMYGAFNQTSLLYKFLYGNHIALIIIPLVFLSSLRIFKKGEMHNHYILYKTLQTIYITIILALCSLLSVYANQIHEHIFPYFIAMFCIASVLILSLYESLPVYLISDMILSAGFLLTRNSPDEVFQSVFFSTLLTVLSVVISNINYSAYIDNFLNRKLIHEKNMQLDNMYKTTGEMLKQRTDELTNANVELINRINSGHEMEIQFIKAQKLNQEKDRALNQAMENEKLRTVFFANLSHELRTPLTLIYSSQQMLDLLLGDEKYSPSTEEIQQYMHIIRQNCHRLLRLISNLIDITKIDAGYFQIYPVNCDIVKIIEDITLSVAKYIEDKNISLVFDTDIEERLVACDPDKMERIMLNLLSNAVKFTPEGGKINVNIYDRSQNIVICVKDSGIGIPEGMQDIIFQRFVQINNVMTRKREGSGIGLSLIKSLVELHNGKITVSSNLGEGSEFIIEIPCTILPEEPGCINYSMAAGQFSEEKISTEFSDIYI